MLDIDHFKTINDEYGHAVGDAVLRGVGQRIGRALRSFDCAARWGGEEFCAVLPGAGSDDRLYSIGERLRAAVAGTPIETSVGPIRVTVSIGGATTADGLDDADALVDAADQALYAAKRRGRDQVRTFATLSQRDREEAAPRIVRLAEVLALTASVREGMPPLHCRQVSELASAVAVALGLPRHVAVRCQVAGWLHDVGKVAIPDAILRKTGTLDADEMETMRAHAVIGDQLVRQVQELADAAPGVRHHHERWDGTGYPDGLAGDDIPIEARIVAAVDAYSAMTIERVYRRPMERPQALAELHRSAGTHLDPAVVQALVGVLERGLGELSRAA
jgi:diguanylate cyclase (GGDEF)-like protein